MGGFGFDLRGLVCHTLRGALGGMAFYKALHTFLMVGGLIAGWRSSVVRFCSRKPRPTPHQAVQLLLLVLEVSRERGNFGSRSGVRGLRGGVSGLKSG